MYTLQAPAYRLTLGGDSFLTYTTPTATRSLQGPVIEVDGEALLPRFSSVELASVTPLPDGRAGMEIRFAGEGTCMIFFGV